jgi:CheY-like chemotaxis protein
MSGAKILVVEDEWLVAQGLKENLLDLGYDVVGLAASGEEALALAAARRPDLVLMDILLKGDMDGIEAAEHLRRSFELPALFLTAYADSQTLGRAKVTEPYGYLLKPFEVRELHSAIEIALYKSQSEKKLRHLNQVLRATRSIGQLIVQEKDRDRLIRQACQLLTEGRGYFTAWLALLDEDGRVAAAAATGVDDRFTQALLWLQEGQIPPCGRLALEDTGLVVRWPTWPRAVPIGSGMPRTATGGPW